MAKPPNLINQKSAILLSDREVSVQEWLVYLENNWVSLTESLTNFTILILAGRHGKDDGMIGKREDVLMEQFGKLVSFLTPSEN